MSGFIWLFGKNIGNQFHDFLNEIIYYTIEFLMRIYLLSWVWVDFTFLIKTISETYQNIFTSLFMHN